MLSSTPLAASAGTSAACVPTHTGTLNEYSFEEFVADQLTLHSSNTHRVLASHTLSLDTDWTVASRWGSILATRAAGYRALSLDSEMLAGDRLTKIAGRRGKFAVSIFSSSDVLESSYGIIGCCPLAHLSPLKRHRPQPLLQLSSTAAGSAHRKTLLSVSALQHA